MVKENTWKITCITMQVDEQCRNTNHSFVGVYQICTCVILPFIHVITLDYLSDCFFLECNLSGWFSINKLFDAFADAIGHSSSKDNSPWHSFTWPTSELLISRRYVLSFIDASFLELSVMGGLWLDEKAYVYYTLPSLFFLFPNKHCICRCLHFLSEKCA